MFKKNKVSLVYALSQKKFYLIFVPFFICIIALILLNFLPKQFQTSIKLKQIDNRKLSFDNFFMIESRPLLETQNENQTNILFDVLSNYDLSEAIISSLISVDSFSEFIESKEYSSDFLNNLKKEKKNLYQYLKKNFYIKEKFNLRNVGIDDRNIEINFIYPEILDGKMLLNDYVSAITHEEVNNHYNYINEFFKRKLNEIKLEKKINEENKRRIYEKEIFEYNRFISIINDPKFDELKQFQDKINKDTLLKSDQLRSVVDLFLLKNSTETNTETNKELTLSNFGFSPDENIILLKIKEIENKMNNFKYDPKNIALENLENFYQSKLKELKELKEMYIKNFDIVQEKASVDFIYSPKKKIIIVFIYLLSLFATFFYIISRGR